VTSDQLAPCGKFEPSIARSTAWRRKPTQRVPMWSWSNDGFTPNRASLDRDAVHGSCYHRASNRGPHMIPDIGIMIAAYIVTRMAALLGQPTPQANVASKILAVLTIIVTIVCGFDLIVHGINTPSVEGERSMRPSHWLTIGVVASVIASAIGAAAAATLFPRLQHSCSTIGSGRTSLRSIWSTRCIVPREVGKAGISRHPDVQLLPGSRASRVP
jgi:hypothetical protein